MTPEQIAEDILRIIDEVGNSHRVESYECDLCGEHYHCYTCDDALLSSDHVQEKAKEAVTQYFKKASHK